MRRRHHESFRNCKGICMVRHALAITLVVGGGRVMGENIYELSGDVSGTVDLLNMPGYYADRVLCSADNVAASFTYEAGLTPAHPFLILGNGKYTNFNTTPEFTAVPVWLSQSDGAPATSYYGFQTSPAFNGLTVDAGTIVEIGYMKSLTVRGQVGAPADLIVNGGKIQAWGPLVVGNSDGDANLKLLSGSIGPGYMGNMDVYVGKEESPGRSGTPLRVTADVRASLTARYCYLLDGVFEKTSSDQSGTEQCFITNGINGVVSVRQVVHVGGNRSRLTFDGGRMVFPDAVVDPLFKVQGQAWNGTRLYPWMTLEGVNGNPIDIEISSDRPLGGGNAWNHFNVTGDGGFTKRGAGVLNWSTIATSVSTCNYTGPTTVLGGGIKLDPAKSNFIPGRGALALASGTTFDLNGVGGVQFTGVSGDGHVVNTSATVAGLALGYGNGNGDFDASIASDIAIEKIGNGTLTLKSRAAGYTGNVMVSAGTLKLAADVRGLGTVTVCTGATLDIRGRSFGCRTLVNNGTLLTDADTDLCFGGDAYSTMTSFGLSGCGFRKIGSGELALTCTEWLNGRVTVSEGTLVCRPCGFDGKYYKFHFGKKDDRDGNYIKKCLSELSLFDGSGARINTGLTWLDLGDDQWHGLAGMADASSLEVDKVVVGAEGFYDGTRTYPPSLMFDGNPATGCQVNWDNSDQSYILFRLSDGIGTVTSYNLTSLYGCYGVAAWKLFGSYDGVNWTVLSDHSADWSDPEAKAAALAEVPQTNQTEYNGGIPYVFESLAGTNGTVFGSGATISVAAGAGLEGRGMAMDLPSLEVDMSAGAGTIRNARPVRNGRLVLLNCTAAGEVSVPVTLVDIVDGRMFRSWSLTVNGEESDWVVMYRRGRLLVGPRPGMTVELR